MSHHVYNTLAITMPFEELALYTKSTDRGRFQTGRIDGKFEVSVPWHNPLDWHISDIWIVADNGRCGNQCEVEHINLDADADERFYVIVLDALTERYHDQIEEEIEIEFGEAGIAMTAA